MNAHRLLLCLAAAAGSAVAMPPDPVEIASRAGMVQFSHRSHAIVPCMSCHHTSPGIRIKHACRDCHLPDSHMPRNSRDAFHGSCIGCHIELYKRGNTDVPAKRCSGCHENRGWLHRQERSSRATGK